MCRHLKVSSACTIPGISLLIPNPPLSFTKNMTILQPSYMFTDKEYRGPFAFSEELSSMPLSVESADNIVSAQRVEENDKDLLLSTSEKEETRVPSNNDSAYSAPSCEGSTAALQSQFDLVSLDNTAPVNAPPASIAIDDLLGLNLAPTPAPAPPPVLNLNAKAVLAPNAFQQKWRQLPISKTQVF